MTSQTTGILTSLAAFGTNDRAVVIGAGMGGLLAARALADHYRQVIVLDRDTLPTSPGQRRNVPQGQHVHGLLARGRVIVERMLPGITEDLIADGAILANSKRDLTWFQQEGYHATPKRGISVLLMSRPLLEYHVRRRVATLPNVTVIGGCQVTGLLVTRDRQRVTGVRVADTDDRGTEHVLLAHLTVDASGRGSRLPAWLEQFGYDLPDTVVAGVESRYATRRFRRIPGQGGGRLATVIVASPHLQRGGVMLAQEGDEWLVSLASRGGLQPPTELSAFVDWAASLEAPDIFDTVRQAIPLDDGAMYRFPQSTRRHFERMERFPEGLLPIGDAVCSFNPVYAQGMSVAAIEAETLGRCVAYGQDQLSHRFFASIMPSVDATWLMAANGDLRYATGPIDLPRPARIANAYMGRLLAVAQRDAVVSEAFQRVTNLLDPPQALRRPGIAMRIALASIRREPPTPPRHADQPLATAAD